MIAPLSLADRAADFVMAVTEDEQCDIRAIASLLLETADCVAVQAGAKDFVGLSDTVNVMAVATASAISRDAFEHALNSGDDRLAGATAAVHLMSLNLVDGLKSAEAAQKIAEMAAYLYSQEYAHRQLIGSNPRNLHAAD
ncbi:MAG: hypothetical protein V4502_05580 [Pseudomonadota bacterium]